MRVCVCVCRVKSFIMEATQVKGQGKRSIIIKRYELPGYAPYPLRAVTARRADADAHDNAVDTVTRDKPTRTSMSNYSKWDNLDDSDDEADNALEKAQALNERGSKLLTGQGKAPQPEAALECFEQACKQLLRDGKPVSSDARDLAGGVMLNMAVAAHELKRHRLLSVPSWWRHS